MSTLHTFSCFLGRAMNLPPVFFRKVPYISILDQSIALSDLIGKKRNVRRVRRTKSGYARAGSNSVPAHQVVLEGAITQGSETRYAIEGVDFCVSAGTWIIGEPQVGGKARVKGTRSSDSTPVVASSIVVIGA